MFYFATGDRRRAAADALAAQVAEDPATQCGANTRLGVDKILLLGARALGLTGFELMGGE